MSGDGYSDDGQQKAWLIRVGVGVVLGLIAMVVYFAANYQTGPGGRGQLAPLTADQEVALGAQAFNEVLKDAHALRSGDIVKQVDQVTMRRLVPATKDSKFLALLKLPDRPYKWQVEVVDSKQVNAFCLPGGKMVVYTGILPVCATESGLATVMGHEISHALCRHGGERMGQEKMLNLGLSGVGVGLGDMDPEKRNRILGVLGAGAKYGVLMPYGRNHESEADKYGLLLMATAGFDPREAVKFWERMKGQSGGSPPEFMSTHPSHGTRIARLKELMPQALELYKTSKDRDLPDQKLKWPGS